MSNVTKLSPGGPEFDSWFSRKMIFQFLYINLLLFLDVSGIDRVLIKFFFSLFEFIYIKVYLNNSSVRFLIFLSLKFLPIREKRKNTYFIQFRISLIKTKVIFVFINLWTNSVTIYKFGIKNESFIRLCIYYIILVRK